ncbi:MAG: hypothetical protein JO007_21815 [Alphaproteobacteria bacterium]|nr:hypothetical protein [Alphaproteobacteria bacterium]
MKHFLATIALFLAPVTASAANTTVSIVFNSPASTGISCTAGGPFTVPVAAGTQIATCAVNPSNWSGALTLSGSQASNFALSGTNIVVGTNPITTAGTVTLTLTATP